jgi:hypothetical protein
MKVLNFSDITGKNYKLFYTQCGAKVYYKDTMLFHVSLCLVESEVGTSLGN